MAPAAGAQGRTPLSSASWMSGDGCPSLAGSPNDIGTEATPRDQRLAVRCCTAAGQCDSNPNGVCFPAAATHAEAAAACRAAGRRLCTLAELEARDCCGTGCQYDSKRLWTSTPAPGVDAPWQCLPGIGAPVRLTVHGDAECGSADGVSCSAADCAAALARPEATSLTCGAHHSALYGTTGYEDPAHWCFRARALLAGIAFVGGVCGRRPALVIGISGNLLAVAVAGACGNAIDDLRLIGCCRFCRSLCNVEPQTPQSSCPIGGGGGAAHGNDTSSPGTPTIGLRERGNDTSRSIGRSGRQNAAIRRNMRREERVTVQGPVKKQQPDGMSHGNAARHVGMSPHMQRGVGSNTRKTTPALPSATPSAPTTGPR